MLVEGANELERAFRPPGQVRQRAEPALGARPPAVPAADEAIRKRPAIRLGLGDRHLHQRRLAAVRLELWSAARIAEVRCRGRAEDDGGSPSTPKWSRAARAALTPALAGREVTDVGGPGRGGRGIRLRAHRRRRARRELLVARRPRRAAALRVHVALRDETAADDATRRVGFRSVLWTRTRCEGRRSSFVVNGRPIFVKGVNWIPDDSFPCRVTAPRYARGSTAADANVNLLRVWGGGIYETDEFYDLCDELGLLIWQDFLFACAAYPEDEPCASEVEAEARENVDAAAHHASLVMLTGTTRTCGATRTGGGRSG